MGGKITIDSATLMNKGLEVMEAHHLFGVGYDRIEVLVHPQSLVHGIVHLPDGAMLAHMGPPDMRIAISYALHGGESVELPYADLDELCITRQPDERSPAPALVGARAGGRRPASTQPTRSPSTRSSTGAFASWNPRGDRAHARAARQQPSAPSSRCMRPTGGRASSPATPSRGC
jgi:hypothetical protein